jgi:uncharacterized protein (DUF58 family)
MMSPAASSRAPLSRHAHTDAAALAALLPQMQCAAQALSAHIAYGVHGRRRAGRGDDFWQFRSYMAGESAGLIDWRRSARDRHFYVREREWEGAQQMWLWVDRSLTMRFASSRDLPSKHDRAIVLALAMADLVVRGGEKIGLLGLSSALARRSIIAYFAALLSAQSEASMAAHLPVAPPTSLPAHYVLISDFLAPLSDYETMIARLAQRGERGFLLIISDPVEEMFPFQGRIELRDMSGRQHYFFGEGQDARGPYLERLHAHRQGLYQLCRAYGWRYVHHRTDHAPAPALLALHMALAGEGRGAGRYAGVAWQGDRALNPAFDQAFDKAWDVRDN